VFVSFARDEGLHDRSRQAVPPRQVFSAVGGWAVFATRAWVVFAQDFESDLVSQSRPKLPRTFLTSLFRLSAHNAGLAKTRSWVGYKIWGHKFMAVFAMRLASVPRCRSNSPKSILARRHRF
jgi:hypothetical protein